MLQKPVLHSLKVIFLQMANYYELTKTEPQKLMDILKITPTLLMHY